MAATVHGYIIAQWLLMALHKCLLVATVWLHHSSMAACWLLYKMPLCGCITTRPCLSHGAVWLFLPYFLPLSILTHRDRRSIICVLNITIKCLLLSLLVFIVSPDFFFFKITFRLRFLVRNFCTHLYVCFFFTLYFLDRCCFSFSNVITAISKIFFFS